MLTHLLLCIGWGLVLGDWQRRLPKTAKRRRIAKQKSRIAPPAKSCAVTRRACSQMVSTQLFKTSIILLCWIIGGVCYAVYHEGWCVATATARRANLLSGLADEC